MNRYTSKLILAVALGAGVAAAGSVLANGAMGHGACARGFHAGMGAGFGYSEARIKHLAKRLDLTDKQLASLRAIVDHNRPQLRTLLDRMADNRRQIHALIRAGKDDQAKVRAVADRQGKTIADMIVLRVEMKADIDKLLTDKQRQKLRHKYSSMHRGWEAHGY